MNKEKKQKNRLLAGEGRGKFGSSEAGREAYGISLAASTMGVITTDLTLNSINKEKKQKKNRLLTKA